MLRRLADEVDWWRIRDLLIETFSATPRGWNWDIRRWDGSRFHNVVVTPVRELSTTVALAEDPEGRLLGAVHDDGRGQAVFELRPEARALEPDLLDWAETHLATPGADGSQRLGMTVYDDDAERQALLDRRGWTPTEAGGWNRTMSLGTVRAGVPAPPAGYEVRTTRVDIADSERMATLLNTTFRRTIHSAAEYTTFMTRSPSFDEALNLVAIAPDGSFAAHVGLSLDRRNRHAIVEPVATHPDHRRLGLARILLLEGLRRAAAAGARTADVETGDAPAGNALYEAVGFGSARRMREWRSTALESTAAPGGSAHPR